MISRNYRLVSLTLCLVVTAGIGMSAFAQTTARKCKQVAVKLDSRNATQQQVAQQIKQQLATCGISATDKEIQDSAKNSLDLVSKGKDPEKGVIYVKTKKFTICASWGRDKEFCDTH